MRYRIILIALIFVLIPIDAQSNIPAKILKEGVEKVIQKSTQDGTEQVGRKTGVEIVEILSENGVKVGAGIGIAAGGYQVGKGIRLAIEDTGTSISEQVSQAPTEEVVQIIPNSISRTAGYVIFAIALPILLLQLYKTYLQHRREIRYNKHKEAHRDHSSAKEEHT